MEKTETLDKTSELAKEKLSSMETAEKAEQKVKEESKDASLDKSSTETQKIEEQKKKEEETKAKESESTTKNDVQILESEDKDLTEEELSRKEELVKEKEDAKTPEQKIAEWQENTQKRIDGFIGELKAEKGARVQDAKTIKSLEGTIAKLKGDLETSGSIESDADKIMKSEEELYAKMIEEDKDLPREKRREMSEDELEEFMLENMHKYNEWMIDRKFRRIQDRAAKKEVNKAADDIDKRAKQFFTKYPDCDQSVRAEQLIAIGKSGKEATETIMKEVPDFKLFMEIMKDHPEWRDPNTDPDLLMTEMNKRKTSKPNETEEMISKEEAEKMRDDAVEAEKQRIASIDTGITNSFSPVGTVADRIKDDPLVKQQWEAWCTASKRPSARGQDWSEKAFLETLDYGNRQRKVHPLSKTREGVST